MGSIVVANSNPDYAKRIASVLHSSGLYVGGIYTSGAQLIHFANQHYHGGVAVCSVKLRDMSAVGLPRTVGPAFDFLFLVRPQLAGMLGQLESASLLLPIRRMDLISTVNMFLNLADPTPPAIKKKIQNGNYNEKKILMQAKNLLMGRNNLTEPQAHRLIQKKSMDTGRKMAETAMIILNG
jgi:response regulator NasT